MPLRTVIIIVFALSLHTCGFGQHLPGNAVGSGLGLNITDQMLQMDTRKFLYGSDGQKIDGSPYLDENFSAGEVLSNKGKFTGVELRYNLYSDQIEFKQRDVVYALTPGPEIKKVNFGNYTFGVGKTDLKGQKKNGFFVLLDSGKVTLVVRKKVTFREA